MVADGYDEMAGLYQKKIWQLQQAQAQFRETRQLPPPESLGFYLKPEAAATEQQSPQPPK